MLYRSADALSSFVLNEASYLVFDAMLFTALVSDRFNVYTSNQESQYGMVRLEFAYRVP